MAHGDHLAQFKADQLDAWERRLAQFSKDAVGWIAAGKGGELAGIPEDLRVREFPEVGS